MYSQASDEKEADAFHSAMNSAHPRIQFEIEKPTTFPNGSQSLSLLDFTLTITPAGDTVFEFFKKKTKKPIFLNYRSATSNKVKKNVIYNEIQRINKRCSSPSIKKKHRQAFAEVLSVNDSPKNLINNIPDYTPHRRLEPPPNNDVNWLYLRTPYISDAIDQKITNIFKDEGFPVRVVHRSTSLRQALAPNKRENRKCTRPTCAAAK